MRPRLLLSLVGLFVWSPLPAQTNLGDAFVFENGNGDTMPYRLFTPPIADSMEGPLPLIVFMHGSGSRGSDNVSQVNSHIGGLIEATQSHEFASYLLAPQVPFGGSWNADGRTDLTMDIMQSLKQSLEIDEDRIYITGNSMGGFGSFEYLSQFPDTFAAAVPMSGGHNPATVETIKDVPVWMFHGDRDPIVKPIRSRQMYTALEAAGGSPLLSEILGRTHGIWAPIYEDASSDRFGMYDWLFQQRRGRRDVEVPLIDFGDAWTYSDDGSEPDGAWRDLAFDDSAWSKGGGQFGYGDEDETTLVQCGPAAPDCSEKYSTYYFRRQFDVADPSVLSSALVQVIRDDRIVVYLNGEEVFREKYLSDSIDNGHVAFRIKPASLESTNILAIEVHQSRSKNDSDLSFDLRMKALAVPEPFASTQCLFALISMALATRRRGIGRTVRFKPPSVATRVRSGQSTR